MWCRHADPTVLPIAGQTMSPPGRSLLQLSKWRSTMIITALELRL